MNDRVGRIRQKITEGFSPSQCEVEDESALHAGHAGAASGGGHYRLRLVSPRFEGLGRLARHRLVYDCLADMMHKEIHALAIVALTPAEAAQQPGK
ncbi:BolA family protein [Oxalobacteraceae bacterium R-40]|uniref:BolA family protein n=1 Tax=Keguizhuia sedimenti TaxID=3064264 RepID=A0ABU1BQ41_9BURK|nr:BolA family protein [Oxalobacteraceae bacterium R-40]